MGAPSERSISFDSGGLQLEGRFHDGEGALAAVVLHPHPQYGGDMDSHVVTAICGALAALGGTTLRFNFRGAGQSEGQFENGRGEALDVLAAVRWLRESTSEAPLILAGYSFGAMIAASIAQNASPKALVLVSPPLGMGPMAALADSLPTLVVAGERDPISPAEPVRALAGPRIQVAIVPGMDHTWWPGVDLVEAEISSFVGKLVSRGSDG